MFSTKVNCAVTWIRLFFSYILRSVFRWFATLFWKTFCTLFFLHHQKNIPDEMIFWIGYFYAFVDFASFCNRLNECGSIKMWFFVSMCQDSNIHRTFFSVRFPVLWYDMIFCICKSPFGILLLRQLYPYNFNILGLFLSSTYLLCVCVILDSYAA